MFGSSPVTVFHRLAHDPRAYSMVIDSSKLTARYCKRTKPSPAARRVRNVTVARGRLVAYEPNCATAPRGRASFAICTKVDRNVAAFGTRRGESTAGGRVRV